MGSQDGSELQFKIRKNTPFQKVKITVYARSQIESVGSIRLLSPDVHADLVFVRPALNPQHQSLTSFLLLFRRSSRHTHKGKVWLQETVDFCLKEPYCVESRRLRR